MFTGSRLRRGPAAARTALAVAAGRAAAAASRIADYGDGTAVGGWVARHVAPDVIADLCAGKDVVLVSATNGKSTAATMLAAALETLGPVAFNAGGANMHAGVAMGLAERSRATRAVLEVDEMVLGPIARETSASWIVLMNTSREYTRGISLQATLEHWDATLGAPDLTASVVANADDPLLVATCRDLDARGRVIWVAGGLSWRRDAVLCRLCGDAVTWPDDGPHWWCTGCGLTRPEPAWNIVEGAVHGPDGFTMPLLVRLPGRWLASNALFAVAAAAAIGAQPRAAVRAACGIGDVDGRYRAVDVQGRQVRLYLVKNPASWDEAVSLATEDGTVVLAMETFSMRDLTPAWDTDVSVLRGTQVVATGQRRLDVAALLETSGVPHQVVAEPLEAILSLPQGPVHVIANYTAFKELRRRLVP